MRPGDHGVRIVAIRLDPGPGTRRELVGPTRMARRGAARRRSLVFARIY